MATTLYLILLTYTQPAEVVAGRLEEHRAFLRRGYAEGAFIVSGPREPPDGGVILARAASEGDVRARLRDDPFAQHGLATYQIIPFDARWSAPAFAPFLTPFPAPADDAAPRAPDDVSGEG